MPLIIGAKSATATGYTVDNSCRFNAPDAPYFDKAPSASGNQRTFTISVWLKEDIHASGDTHKVFEAGSSTDYFSFYFTSTQFLVVKGRVSSANVLELITTQKFRDPTAWFHLYIAVDTTQGTDSNRCKVYINGTQVTDFSTENYPDQNTDFLVNDTSEPFEIGVNQHHGSDEHFDGYMAEYMYVDGAAQDIGDFGEFDGDSPTIWKPIDISGIAVNPDGASGFYLDFKDSSNLGNDAAGGTDFTANNIDATDQTTDTPTNNFCTINPLMITATDGTISEGNTTWTRSGNWVSVPANFGMTAGKWYWEVEGTSSSGDVSQTTGIANGPTTSTQTMADWNTTNVHLGDSNQPDSYAHWSTGTLTYKYNAGSNSVWGTGTGAGPVIIQVAFDADNGTIWVGKDGTWMNSATQGEIEAGTTTNAMYSGITVDSSNPYFPAVSCEDNAAAFNFGNPSFAISSSNADGNGYGNFEYAVPSGYYALCTKNLGAYGG